MLTFLASLISSFIRSSSWARANLCGSCAPPGPRRSVSAQGWGGRGVVFSRTRDNANAASSRAHFCNPDVKGKTSVFSGAPCAAGTAGPQAACGRPCPPRLPAPCAPARSHSLQQCPGAAVESEIELCFRLWLLAGQTQTQGRTSTRSTVSLYGTASSPKPYIISLTAYTCYCSKERC